MTAIDPAMLANFQADAALHKGTPGPEWWDFVCEHGWLMGIPVVFGGADDGWRYSWMRAWLHSKDYQGMVGNLFQKKQPKPGLLRTPNTGKLPCILASRHFPELPGHRLATC
jgi:hypothetical protein